VDALTFGVLGLGVGGAYALLAQGILVVYRGSGTVNFAQGAIAMISAYLAYQDLAGHVTVPVAMALGVVAGAVVGLLQYLLVMRWLRNSSPLRRLIGTLGVMLLLEAIATLRYGSTLVLVSSPFPTKPVTVLPDLTLTLDRLIMLGVAIVASCVLAWLYKHTFFGHATTAVSENELAAAAVGLSPDRIAMVNWTLGGALAGIAGVLIAPISGLNVDNLVLTVVVAVTATLVGRFHSFILTLLGGLAIGVGQSEIARFVTTPGASTAFPLVVIIVALVFSGKSLPERGVIADRLPKVGSGRINPALGLLIAGAVTALIWTVPVAWVDALTASLVACLLLLSLVVVTGYAGQVSLGHAALAGVGAFVVGRLVATTGMPVEVAVLCALGIAIPAGLLFAIPAVRIRGTTLAILTLSLGMAINAVVFQNAGWTGGLAGTTVGVLKVFGLNIDYIEHPQRYATAVLIVVVVSATLVSVVRRSALGYRMLAVRENELAATAIGVDVARTKAVAFAVSSGIAAIAGVCLAFQGHTVEFTSFDVLESLFIVGYAVVGGVGMIGGALLGATLADGGPGAYAINQLGGLGAYLNIIIASLLILNVLTVGDGAAVAFRMPKRLARWLPPWPGERKLTKEPSRHEQNVGVPVLDVDRLSLNYGGIRALDNIRLRVQAGEIVGLIGPNGAGKTSLLDAISGLANVNTGSVRVAGTDVRGLPPAARARLGLGRTFQAAELFEDLTIGENLKSARWSTGVRAALASLSGACAVPEAALESLESIAVGDPSSMFPHELSLGQRRVAAVARALAGDPIVLMLDEPAAGLDEVKIGELTALLRRIAGVHNIGVLLVEHHVGLIMDVCDRVYVLESGKLLAEGTPEEVGSDERVTSAYLGDELEIEQLAPQRAGEEAVG
jgi:ABC-type branched-subunit amino acid transport system ATPase component/branched-subunit amino acid ABC-type transport system permease component